MYSSAVTGLVPAPRADVYRALLDPAAVGHWRVPDGMSGEVHEPDPRVGGRIRMDGLPDAVPADQNELGTRMALDKLARLVGWDT